MSDLGVHSEVGKLRTVLVCRPGLAHLRLTPTNCRELLFDDVIWVQQAKTDHYDFCQKIRDRGVEVLEVHDVLAATLDEPDGRKWLLDHRIGPDDVGTGMLHDLRDWLDHMPAAKLAEHLIGGIARAELPFDPKGVFGKYLDPQDFVIPPIPNILFQRDPSCWIYGGVTVNPMFWPARQPETLLMTAIYRFHPRFRDKAKIWWGDPTVGHGRATVEGGDVMPIGNKTVLVGMGERTTPQAVGQIARALFKEQAAERVIACQMPRSRAAMHLDTVFSLCDRDVATAFIEVCDQIKCYSIRPADDEEDVDYREETQHLFDVVADGLKLNKLRVVQTGGDDYQSEREQWDDGNNVVALEPGVVVAYERNIYTNTLLRKAGVEVITRVISSAPSTPRPSSSISRARRSA
jgi:arginine deiminase